MLDHYPHKFLCSQNKVSRKILSYSSKILVFFNKYLVSMGY